MTSKGDLPDYDGHSAFGGALRFLDPDDCSWKERWGQSYGYLAPNLRFIAADAFGTMYGLDDAGKVAIFWAETGEVELLGVEPDKFFSMILEDTNGTINLDLYREAVRKIAGIGLQQHFAFKVEIALGGQLVVDNIMAMDADEHMRVLGSLAQQIHAVPVGSRFDGVKMKP